MYILEDGTYFTYKVTVGGLADRRLKANSHTPCRAHAVPHSHMPCRAHANLRQCRVLRESPRGSRKYPNC
jgi:hypothetical protein